jgi:hypothetical protein
MGLAGQQVKKCFSAGRVFCLHYLAGKSAQPGLIRMNKGKISEKKKVENKKK